MRYRQNERGVALIICLFALMLLSGIGLGMMYMADTETVINRNYRDSQRAYFAALGGVQEVRERLMTGAVSLTPPTTMPANPSAATGVVYVLNWGNGIAKTDIQPWNSSNAFFDDELCHENFGAVGSPILPNTGANTPCADVPSGAYGTADSNLPGTLGTSANVPWRWVRITLKANRSSVPDPAATPVQSFYVGSYSDDNTVPVCWDGTKQLLKPGGYSSCNVDPPPDGITYLENVYVLTSLAVIPNSNARRMVQMEVANDPPFVSNAALDTDDFVSVHGSSVTVNGYDNCHCSCTIGHGSATPTCTDRITGGACTGTTYSIYSSSDIDTSGNPALVAGTSPTYRSNVSPYPYDETFIQSLIDRYSAQSGAVNVTQPPYNLTCTSGTPFDTCGTLTTASIGTPPTGFPSFDPSNPTGLVNQVTYVPGSVDLQSHTSGAGVLVVDGDLTVHGGLDFYGLIIVKGILTFSGGGSGQATNVIGSIISGQSSVADTSLGGGINIQYDRCALLHNKTPAPPTLLSTHEVSY